MKKLITNYTFDASAQTITFSDYTSILREGILLITNVTDNLIIYNFADPTAGGTVLTNVLTLDYTTTSMDDTDDLQIFYDDATNSLTDVELRASAVTVTVDQLEMLIRLLIESVAAPIWYNYARNGLNVITQTDSTTVVSSGTITTVTGLTNIGSQPASSIPIDTSAIAWGEIRGLLT